MPSVRNDAPAAAPPAPPGTPQPPAAVPRSSPAPPPEPPSDPYKTYNTLGPARPPKKPPKAAAPEPAAPAAAAPAEPAAVAAPPPAAATPPPPAAERPAKPPRPPRRSPAAVLRDLDRRIYAILAAIVVGAALVAGIAVIGSKSKDKVPPEPTQAAAVVKPKPKKTRTPKPTAPALKTQVEQLDRLLQRSKTGRADAVNGDFKAAIANRAQLVKDLQSLEGKAANAQVKAGATAFAAAIRESLRQNRDCASKCSTSDITKVGTLKQTAVDKLNPLLKRFNLGPYTAKEI
jgi:hypothetical protein